MAAAMKIGSIRPEDENTLRKGTAALPVLVAALERVGRDRAMHLEPLLASFLERPAPILREATLRILLIRWDLSSYRGRAVEMMHRDPVLDVRCAACSSLLSHVLDKPALGARAVRTCIERIRTPELAVEEARRMTGSIHRIFGATLSDLDIRHASLDEIRAAMETLDADLAAAGASPLLRPERPGGGAPNPYREARTLGRGAPLTIGWGRAPAGGSC